MCAVSQGRSTGANTLLLWMREFTTGVTINDQWQGCPGTPPQPALVAMPGTYW
jgi:hypothetical protein